MEHFSLKKCTQNSTWQDDTLLCSCGRQLATRYIVNEEVRIFTYGKFSKYKKQISEREDSQTITKKSDLLGNLDNKEWDEILCDNRQRKTNA